jgi:hypothetical protein
MQVTFYIKIIYFENHRDMTPLVGRQKRSEQDPLSVFRVIQHAAQYILEIMVLQV